MTKASEVFGTNPRTGEPLEPVTDETTEAEVDAHRAELIEIASAETGFGAAKLDGEINRAAFQFRFFGDVISEGSYLEVAIDPPGDTPMGPRPELRRILHPLGPVAVFGSSNFPFAFSVLGGDTASALASGCPVILKAHPSHPATSQLSYEIIAAALADGPAPQGVVAIVYGTRAGAALVAQPAVKAVGFTGSLRGGKALIDIIQHARRTDPLLRRTEQSQPGRRHPGRRI